MAIKLVKANADLKDQDLVYEALLNCGAIKTLDSVLKAKEEEILRVKTNTEIDLLAGGIPMHALSVIAGPTGNGKSLSTLMIAYTLAKNSSVLYISCENRFATDKGRIISLMEKFGRSEGLFYLNIKEIVEKYDAIKSILSKGGFEIVVVDGMQFILPNGKTGAESKAIGETLVKEMLNAVNLNDEKPTFILSWQLRREATSKKLADLTTDDIAMSIDIATACEQMYAVKKCKQSNGGFDICMAAIKNRDIEDGTKSSIQLVKDNKITLKPID